MPPKILCMYLPQFHTIPENDKWWGKGFTEWTNVKRGRPFYPGHYQPRVPLGHDYYDLSDLSVLERHISMARNAGIFGFCFYHYYFNGRTLLESPIEKYRDYSKENYPYCLVWANQSFSRTWYRANNNQEVLLKQKYGREIEWKAHFDYLLSFFKDERYIKVDNKPLYIIYLPQDIFLRKRMFKYWNDCALENGFSGLYLIAMVTGYGQDYHDYYDGYMYFEPMHSWHIDSSWRKRISKLKEYVKPDIRDKTFRNWFAVNNAYSYKYLCKQIERKNESSSKRYFPGVFPGWDNTPRKDEHGLIVKGSNPLLFEKHLRRILTIAEEGEKQFVFINAWNEWSEGAYIEPDERYGYEYLNAIEHQFNMI